MTTGHTRVPKLADLDGMPFLDAGFRWRRLLAMAAAARLAIARGRGFPGTATEDAGSWLEPRRVGLLYPESPPLPAVSLTTAQEARARTVLGGLPSAVAWWKPLTVLPVEFSLLDDGAGSMSASSRDWPQQVLLAGKAFDSDDALREQVLHELAHQWLYLIEDIFPLEGDSPRRLTLPSGTAGRRPAEVIGAAHVAAALNRLYTADPAPVARLQGLACYGRGCLELAGQAAGDLTPEGHAIIQRLKEEF